MKPFRPVLLFLPLFVLLFSCNGNLHPEGEDDGVSACLTLKFSSLPGTTTRVSDLEQTPGETAVNTLDVLVYRADGSGLLDVHHSASDSELESHTVSVDCPVGNKAIFLVANAPSRIEAAWGSVNGLKGELLYLAENSRDSFIMIGTPGGVVSLVSGEGNDLDVELRRYAARVSVRSIRAAFTSPAQRDLPFSIRRVFLACVNPTALALHGDVDDPFGEPDADGRYLWPLSGSSDLMTYAALPSTPSSYAVSGEAERSLTVFDMPSGEGTLYPSVSINPAWSGRILLYMFPNQAEDPVLQTKLVIETEFDGGVYYYSFPIPDIQPNTAYTFTGITLSRVGNPDPGIPVDVTQASFRLEVSDWETGTVLGSYNGQGYRIN